MDDATPDPCGKHDHPECPACGGTFLCMANRAGLCPCTAVSLTRDEMQSLTWLWGESCLCPTCLLAERNRLRGIVPPEPQTQLAAAAPRVASSH